MSLQKNSVTTNANKWFFYFPRNIFYIFTSQSVLSCLTLFSNSLGSCKLVTVGITSILQYYNNLYKSTNMTSTDLCLRLGKFYLKRNQWAGYIIIYFHEVSKTCNFTCTTVTPVYTHWMRLNSQIGVSHYGCRWCWFRRRPSDTET